MSVLSGDSGSSREQTAGFVSFVRQSGLAGTAAAEAPSSGLNASAPPPARAGDGGHPPLRRERVERQTPDKTDKTGPAAGQCAVHGRFLTGRELEAGCCSWCVPDRFDWSPKDRAAIEAMNAPKVYPIFACQRPGCYERFVARSGRTLYCSDECQRQDEETNPF